MIQTEGNTFVIANIVTPVSNSLNYMCNGINMLSITTILRRMVNELYYLLFFTLFIIQEFYIRYNRVKILKKYYQFEYTIDNVSKNMKIYHNEEQYNNENKIQKL